MLTNLRKFPAPYYGGKTHAAALVWHYLGDPAHYVEPLCGTGAVLLNRPHPCNRPYFSETLNDQDGLLIAIEDLAVNRMVHNHCLAKSIQDAAWSQFATFLSYKAAWAGRAFVAVNPAYTSQDCSRCGHREKKTLSQRVHACSCCGLTLDRDHNAALNILTLGQQSLGLVPRSPWL